MMNSDQAPIVLADEATFVGEVLQAAQPVMVAFWAPWSRPCQVFASVLEDVARASGQRVKVVQVDADDNPSLSLELEIQSIPTLLFFLKGRLCAKLVGTASKDAILNRMQAVFPGDTPAPPTRDGGPEGSS